MSNASISTPLTFIRKSTTAGDKRTWVSISAKDLRAEGRMLATRLSREQVEGREVYLCINETLEPALLASVVRAFGLLRRNGAKSVRIGTNGSMQGDLQAIGLGSFVERMPSRALRGDA